MFRNLLKQGSLYTASIIAVKLINLSLVPFFTLHFSPADYGLMDIILTVSVFFNAVISLQMNQGAVRFVSDDYYDQRSKVDISSTALTVQILLGLLAVAFAFLYEVEIENLIFSEKNPSQYILFFAILQMYFNGLFMLCNSFLRAYGKFKEASFSLALQGVSSVLFIVVSILMLDLGVEGYFFGAFAGSFIAFLCELYLLSSKLKIVIRKSALLLLLGFCLPLIPASLAHIVLDMTDRIFIKSMLGFSELGLFALAQKFSSLITVLVSGFSFALGPLVFKDHRKTETKKKVSQILRSYVSFVGVTICCLSLFSVEIVSFFANARYHEASVLMPFMFVTAYSSGAAFFSIGLKIAKKTSVFLLVYLASAFGNIALNFFLIKKIGLEGAAISTLICTFSANTVLFIVSQKYYRLPLKSWRLLTVLTLLGSLSIILPNLVNTLIVGNIYRFLTKTAIICCLSLIFIKPEVLKFLRYLKEVNRS